MKCIAIGCVILVYIARLAYGTCVLDSDFGFILNCNFKKSSLFRVRNLGGVKAHFGLGFSLGDELGFGESLGNVEGNKRRSLNQRDNGNTIGVLPASKLPPTQQTPIQQNRPQAVLAWQPKRLQSAEKRPNTLAMTEAVSLPLGVPAFRPIPSTIPQPQNTFNRKVMYQYPTQQQNLSYPPINGNKGHSVNNINVPAFQAMPSSVSRISTGQIVHVDNQNNFINRNSVYQPNNIKREDVRPSQEQLNIPQVDLMGHTVEELAAVANVSVEAIQKAIQLKQQQLMFEQQAALYQQQLEMMKMTTTQATRPPTTTTTTTTTTSRPIAKYPMAGGHKVMNAPKEYYPVGYDKNFDDNFMSKVDLPATSFHCGDQKHFPGLYADMDLGCMVFHVCALTDDGLIMKSFLCPESTLFDQTILKCNWWFYVDCKGSKSLYDSNLPVSKSYQLMKALTFFSNYKNSQNEKDGVDVEALKNSVAVNKAT